MDFSPVKDILDTVRSVYMNDAAGKIYTDDKLLPQFMSAYGFLETNLEENNIQCKHAVTDPITVLTGSKVLNLLPNDFMWPIAMEERLLGSSDLFIPMIPRRFIPSINVTDKLIYWAWNFDVIEFLGANTDREVRLFYAKRFPTIQNVDSFAYSKAEQYLAAKTAALAHAFLAQNNILAQICDTLAEKNLGEIINIFVKTTQSMPVRRKPYIPFR